MLESIDRSLELVDDAASMNLLLHSRGQGSCEKRKIILHRSRGKCNRTYPISPYHPLIPSSHPQGDMFSRASSRMTRCSQGKDEAMAAEKTGDKAVHKAVHEAGETRD